MVTPLTLAPPFPTSLLIPPRVLGSGVKSLQLLPIPPNYKDPLPYRGAEDTTNPGVVLKRLITPGLSLKGTIPLTVKAHIPSPPLQCTDEVYLFRQNRNRSLPLTGIVIPQIPCMAGVVS